MVGRRDGHWYGCSGSNGPPGAVLALSDPRPAPRSPADPRRWPISNRVSPTDKKSRSPAPRPRAAGILNLPLELPRVSQDHVPLNGHTAHHLSRSHGGLIPARQCCFAAVRRQPPICRCHGCQGPLCRHPGGSKAIDLPERESMARRWFACCSRCPAMTAALETTVPASAQIGSVDSQLCLLAGANRPAEPHGVFLGEIAVVLCQHAASAILQCTGILAVTSKSADVDFEQRLSIECESTGDFGGLVQAAESSRRASVKADVSDCRWRAHPQRGMRLDRHSAAPQCTGLSACVVPPLRISLRRGGCRRSSRGQPDSESGADAAREASSPETRPARFTPAYPFPSGARPPINQIAESPATLNRPVKMPAAGHGLPPARRCHAPSDSPNWPAGS